MMNRKKTLKKTTLVVLSAAMLAGIPQTNHFLGAVSQVSAEEQVTEMKQSGDFYYYIEDREGTQAAIITLYTGKGTEVTIPGVIDGIPVKEAYNVATKQANITKLTYEEGIENIETISECPKLTEINLPSTLLKVSLKKYNDYLIEDCEKLAAINVAEGNEAYASENGVLYTKDKKTLLIYPAAKNNAEFTIPDTVEQVICEANQGKNKYLKKLSIPASVKSIYIELVGTAKKNIYVYGNTDISQCRFGTNTVIHAYKNSAAHNVAAKREYAFKALPAKKIAAPKGIKAKVKNTKKTHSIKITWNKVKNAQAYEVQKMEKKPYHSKWDTTIKVVKTPKISASHKAKSKSKYRIRIRGFYRKNGVKIYGSSSKNYWY